MSESRLRSEIDSTEESQANFLKWKLLLVAATGSASLGVGFDSAVGLRAYAPLVLCLIPILCAYVDLVYFHLTLRIVAIATYLRFCGSDPPDGSRRYEEFVYALRKGVRAHPYALQSIVLSGSTAFLSIFVLTIGWLIHQGWIKLAVERSWLPDYLFIGSGMIGLVLAVVTARLFGSRVAYIERTADRMLQARTSAVEASTAPSPVGAKMPVSPINEPARALPETVSGNQSVPSVAGQDVSPAATPQVHE